MTTEIRPPAAHQRPSGKLYLANRQHNLADGVQTLVLLNTIAADFTDGIEDVVNRRITPGVAGFYDVKAQVYFMNVVADTRYIVFIYRNSVSIEAAACQQASMAEYVSVACSTHIKLSATDYLDLRAQSNAGVNTVDIECGEPYTFLSVQRVR